MNRVESAPARPVPRMRVVGPWFGDPAFVLGSIIWLLTVGAVLLPIMDAEARSTFSLMWGDFGSLCFMLVLSGAWYRRSTEESERRFWALLTVGMAAWVAVQVSFLVGPTDWGLTEDAATDVMYGIFYLCIALALETRPHGRAPHSPFDRRGHGSPVPAILVFFGAAMLYFVVVPSLSNPAEYSTRFSSFTLYVALDIYLVGRVLALWHDRRDEWRSVYRWLAVTFSLWAVTDTLEGLLYVEAIPWIEPGQFLDILWYLPWLTLLIAVTSRRWPPGVRRPPEARAS